MSIPKVSVVIPTRNRPQFVITAVQSALQQSWGDLEVIVVVDGPDDATVSELRKIGDKRLQVHLLKESVGGSDARNMGVSAAKGEWIAFLDDDDEWLPNKLERQMEAASGRTDPIVTCRFLARTSTGSHIWPLELIKKEQPISEYLFVRKGFGRREGFIATPTILTTRSLLSRVPFTPALKRHQDWDWVLRAVTIEQVPVIFCPEALVICNMQDNTSVSRGADYQFSWKWAQGMKHCLTARAYASFLMCHVAWQAAAQREWRKCLPLFWEATRSAVPSIRDVVRYAGFWMLPRTLRRNLSRSTQ